MERKDGSGFQVIWQWLYELNSNPFEDFYVLLVFRFVVYIFLFVKLSDILLGYAKPNLRTRVLRKFQFVYGNQMLKELDKREMEQLQTTINNTILNATKDFSISTYNSHRLVADNSATQIVKDGIQSECGSFRNHEMSQISLSSLSKRSNRSKLRFDLDRNDYHDPLSKNYIIPQPQTQQHKVEYIQTKSQIEVQGQCQQQELSPKNQVVQSNQNQFFKKQNTQNAQLQPQKNQNLLYSYPSNQEANIHYPEEQISGMNLQVQEKFVKDQEDLLHLSEEILHNSLMGNQLTHDSQDQGLRFPSVIKTGSTDET